MWPDFLNNWDECRPISRFDRHTCCPLIFMYLMHYKSQVWPPCANMCKVKTIISCIVKYGPASSFGQHNLLFHMVQLESLWKVHTGTTFFPRKNTLISRLHPVQREGLESIYKRQTQIQSNVIHKLSSTSSMIAWVCSCTPLSTLFLCRLSL